MEGAGSSLETSQKTMQDPCKQNGEVQREVQCTEKLGEQHIMQLRLGQK